MFTMGSELLKNVNMGGFVEIDPYKMKNAVSLYTKLATCAGLFVITPHRLWFNHASMDVGRNYECKPKALESGISYYCNDSIAYSMAGFIDHCAKEINFNNKKIITLLFGGKHKPNHQESINGKLKIITTLIYMAFKQLPMPCASYYCQDVVNLNITMDSKSLLISCDKTIQITEVCSAIELRTNELKKHLAIIDFSKITTSQSPKLSEKLRKIGTTNEELGMSIKNIFTYLKKGEHHKSFVKWLYESNVIIRTNSGKYTSELFLP